MFLCLSPEQTIGYALAGVGVGLCDKVRVYVEGGRRPGVPESPGDGDNILPVVYQHRRHSVPESMGIDMRQVDWAVGGSIYERNCGYCIKAPQENWRRRA